jgi:GNAT superfamily N-acetyltransferase
LRYLLRKLFHRYPMYLIELDLNKPVKEKSKIPLKYIRIDETNYKEVSNIRPWKKNHREFYKMLTQGAIGIAAKDDDVIVGYGWIKLKGCSDDFFIIEDGVCISSNDFVRPEYRGNGIQSAIIKEKVRIINNELNCMKCYGGVFTYNSASLKGAKKFGYRIIKEYHFLRVLKLTLNKAVLKI